MPRVSESRRSALGHWLNSIWYGDRPAPLWLRAGERLYRAATAGRADRPQGRPPLPVIVVGNLVAGGSGKTPVVIALTRALAGAGWHVAIISRGYGGRPDSEPLRVDAETPVEQGGDEALEMARTTGAPVWVARRRVLALKAASDAGAQVVISDDGLQHAALPRSLEICVVDGRRGFGNGRLLPAGPLRQPLARLDTVDLVLVKQFSDGDIGDEIHRRADARAFRIESVSLQPLRGVSDATPPKPPAELDAVAGIADPEPFFEHLEALGYRPRRHALLDHQRILPEWLSGLPGPVVMTVKDAMRLGDDVREDIFTVSIRAELPADALDRILAHVREFQP